MGFGLEAHGCLRPRPDAAFLRELDDDVAYFIIEFTAGKALHRGDMYLCSLHRFRNP